MTLEYSVDDKWLEDSARVFPVVLDPSFYVIVTGSGWDTFVDPYQPTTSFWLSQQLWIGNNSNLSASQSLLYFDLSGHTSSSISVVGATIAVYSESSVYQTLSPPTCYTGNQVEVYALAHGFDGSTNWNNRPKTDNGYPWASRRCPPVNPTAVARSVARRSM